MDIEAAGLGGPAPSSVRHERHAGVGRCAVPVVVQPTAQAKRKGNAKRQCRRPGQGEREQARTGSSARSPIGWTGSPLPRVRTASDSIDTGRSRERARMGQERGKNEKRAHSQRYACARAAEAGAVSAFRTASSRVEATKRTLCTYRVRTRTPHVSPRLPTFIPPTPQGSPHSPMRARSWQWTESECCGGANR